MKSNSSSYLPCHLLILVLLLSSCAIFWWPVTIWTWKWKWEWEWKWRWKWQWERVKVGEVESGWGWEWGRVWSVLVKLDNALVSVFHLIFIKWTSLVTSRIWNIFIIHSKESVWCGVLRFDVKWCYVVTFDQTNLCCTVKWGAVQCCTVQCCAIQCKKVITIPV